MAILHVMTDFISIHRVNWLIYSHLQVLGDGSLYIESVGTTIIGNITCHDRNKPSVKQVHVLSVQSKSTNKYMYSKCSKISNTFHFLFTKRMLVIKAEIHKMLVRIVNREDPDQTASSEAV